MKTQRIAEILKSGVVDSDIVVKGWVRTKRGNKNVAFIAMNDGSCVNNIQVVVDLSKIGEEQLKPITTGACIRVDGRLVASPGAGQGVEVQAERIEIYGTASISTRTDSTTSIRRSSPLRTAKGPAPCSRSRRST